MRVGPFLVVLSAVVLASTACSSATKGPTATVAPTIATTRTTTVSSTAPVATSTTAQIAPQPSPDQAAAALLDAWRRGDRTTALRVASVAAVDALFAHPGSAAQARGCQEPIGPSSDCAFGIGGTNLLTIHTVSVPSGLWFVENVAFES